MASAGSIYFDLLMNDKEFREALKRSKKETSDFVKLQNAASDAFKKMSIGVAAAAVALTALAVRQSAVIDQQAKAARVLGLSVASYQALSSVAHEAGIDQEKLGGLIGKTQKSIYDAAVKGSGAFDRLGLSARSLLQMSPDKQFEAIAQKLAQVESPSRRLSIAMDLFGKSGNSVLLMLEKFGPALEEARAFNDKFNITVSDIDAAKVEEARGAFEKVGKAASGLGNTIAVQVSPLVTALSESLLNAGIDGESFGKAVAGGMNVAAEGIDAVRIAALGIESFFLETKFEVEKLTMDALYNMQQFAVAAKKIPFFSDTAEDASKGIYAAWSSVTENAKATKKQIDALNNAAADFETTSDKIKRIQEEADKRAADKVAGYNNGKPSAAGLLDEAAAKAAEDALERQKKILKDILGPTLDYKQNMEDINALYRAGKINADQYQTAVDKINLKMAEFDKTAAGGLKRGLLEIKDQFNDINSLVSKTLVDGMQSAEDAFVQFAKTGKFSFSDLADSIIADMARISVRQSITAPLAGLFSSATDSITGSLSSLFSGFHADGGVIGPGQWGIVGERGPEVAFGGTTGKTIIPNNAIGSALNVTIVNNMAPMAQASAGRGQNGDLQVMIESAMKDAFGSGRMDKTMRNIYGVSPQLTSR